MYTGFFLLSLDCCAGRALGASARGGGRGPFYYLLIAAAWLAEEEAEQPQAPFYYLLIAATKSWRVKELLPYLLSTIS